MRASYHLIRLVNFITLILAIVVLGGGIWPSSRANTTDCLRFLQWPLIVIGVCILVISIAGFTGACYRNTFLMWLYLFLMFFVIAALIGFIIFAYSVTDKGSGRAVTNRAYFDYYLQDYSGWLEERVASDKYWGKISSCIRDSKVFAKMGRTIYGVPETADQFYQRRLSPIQTPRIASGSNPKSRLVWFQEYFQLVCSTHQTPGPTFRAALGPAAADVISGVSFVQ